MKITRTDIVASFVALAAIFGYVRYDRSVKEEVPATDFFVVRNISVPDFIEDTDPMVVYDRTIKEVFNATWTLEVISTVPGENYAVCTGSGVNHYTPDKELPKEGVRLSWLLGKDCGLRAGQYTIQAHYEIRPEGFPTKNYSATSNIFNVLPRGAQLYIEPEQVEKLEKVQ